MRCGTDGLLALTILVATGCAPVVDKPALDATDSGTTVVRTDARLRTGEQLKLSGDLRFPSGGGPFPAVILMHGCSGLPSRSIEGWEPLLRSWGYATFVLDSLWDRGFREVCTNALLLLPNHRIPDAWGALKILATHPRIDRTRIALMGFSHGGTAALGAATVWAQRTYGGSSQLGFRLVLSFYPYCNSVIPPESLVGVAAPIRIHIGALDDWTPARTCEALVGEASLSGADMRITVYENAHHGFDAVGLPVQFLKDVQNLADCTPRLQSLMGGIVNLLELRKCARPGATIGWNPAAIEEAQRRVRGQLSEFFR